MSSEIQSGLLRVFPLQQYFPRPTLNVTIQIRVNECMHSLFASRRFDGMRIGITANSRGTIDQIPILKAVCENFRARGATPYVIPAIGSHGGGTAVGEIQTLAALGVSNESIGAEILVGIETTLLGSERGVPVYCATNVLSALDGIFVTGRVKEHTDIYWTESEATGPAYYPTPSLVGARGLYWGLESGPHKTLAIGLAKLQAAELHAHTIGLGKAVECAARYMLNDERINVLGALAIVENAYDETAKIEPIACQNADEFLAEERKLLDFSKTLLPHLPWSTGTYDLVYLNRAGKEVGGQGMHTKTLGLAPDKVTPGVAWGPGMPSVHTIVCTELLGTNAMGRGKFFAVHRTRYAERMDERKTQVNAKAAGYPNAVAMPRVYDTDKEMIYAALQVCPRGPNGVRAAFAVSTMWMENIWLSEAFYKDAQELAPNRARILGPPREIPFGADDNISLPTLESLV